MFIPATSIVEVTFSLAFRRTISYMPRHAPTPRHLFSDYSVSCLDPSYAFFKTFALIMVFVWPVGVPALFATILISLRKELRNDTKDEDGELVRNNNRRIDRFAFFFDVYTPNCWWWEIYESLRRVACTGVLVLFPVPQGSS
jgi:hypothetical protein